MILGVNCGLVCADVAAGLHAHEVAMTNQYIGDQTRLTTVLDDCEAMQVVRVLLRSLMHIVFSCSCAPSVRMYQRSQK